MHRTEQEREQFRARLRQLMKDAFGVDDITGVEIFTAIQIMANLSEAMESPQSTDKELSGPRMRLMVRLLAEEQMGNKEGITPTSLSHHQRVSKNTISALLRGLEEQGLIRRELDAQDYRLFRILLTDEGRALVREQAPRRIERMNFLASALSKEEQQQLMHLLDKLQHALIETAHREKNDPVGG